MTVEELIDYLMMYNKNVDVKFLQAETGIELKAEVTPITSGNFDELQPMLITSILYW